MARWRTSYAPVIHATCLVVGDEDFTATQPIPPNYRPQGADSVGDHVSDVGLRLDEAEHRPPRTKAATPMGVAAFASDGTMFASAPLGKWLLAATLGWYPGQ